MTIHRNGGRITFQCDSCLDEYESEDGQEFMDAWNDAKNTGWRSYKDDLTDEWVHKCPRCMKRGRG